MKEWMLWVVLALPVAVVGLLSPRSERIARALRSAAAAVMLAALLSPLAGWDPSALFDPPSVETFVPEGGAAWREAVREGFEAGLEAELFSRFSMQVEIQAVLDESGVPQSVVAILERKDLFGDAVGLSHYIERSCNVECRIEYKEE